MPTGLHAHAHLFSLGREVAIKLFRPVAVFQALLSAISRFGIHKRNLLEARVIISSYNDHCRLLSTRAFLVGKRHQVYSGVWEPALLCAQCDLAPKNWTTSSHVFFPSRTFYRVLTVISEALPFR